AGRNKMAITSVPIRTNGELRPSRLFNSMFGYIKKSMLTIGRAYMMYRPLAVFTAIASVFAASGSLLGIRYLHFMRKGEGKGHIHSLIVASMLIIIGTMAGVVGLLADVISSNRKLIQEVQYQLRKMDYGPGHEAQKRKTADDEI
ncbi:MAG: glycosyltransferase family 2 protein, partial [Lachnospiraceae bacterium]|nr:glycosyltransferase family 2 protein [Lachnospiraceae bacterium]